LFVSEARRRRLRQRTEARKGGRANVYELQFHRPLELLFGGGGAEAAVSVVRRIAGDAPPLCVACDSLIGAADLGLVMTARPFANRRAKMIVGAVCNTCAGLEHPDLVAACLQTFRANGMADATEVQAGAA
jgi:hypothetical protein